MNTKNKEIFEKGARLYTEMESIVNNAKSEGRGMTKDEETRFDKLNEEHVSIEKLLESDKAIEQRKSVFEQKIEQIASENNKSVEQVNEEVKRVLDTQLKYVRFGVNALSSEEQAILAQTRAQTTSDSAGGYTIDSILANEIIKSLKDFSGVRQVAKIINTSTGADLIYPTNNDTSNLGAILSEATADTELDTVMGAKTITAYMYTSKIITISKQLLQDSAFDLIGFITNDIFVNRIGRIQNKHFTVGTGSSQPEGLAWFASQGAVAADDATIALNDLLTLKHSVDVGYRANGTFMMNDATLLAIKKLSLAGNYPLFQPSFAAGAPSTIDGSNYVVNNDMPNIGAGDRSVLFGDFSKYIIRDAGGMQVMRMTERYAEYLKDGLIGYMRTDGKLLDTAAVKALRHPNT
jgi:HK97 family phage major capsid protein